MQNKHWIVIANFRQVFYFAVFLSHKKNSFLKQQHEQLMPEPLRFHPGFCGFYTVYSAFHLFKFRQGGITRVHDVNVLSFISNYV